MSAQTIDLGLSESVCPSCVGEGDEEPECLRAMIEVSASGFAQMLVMKCSRHGPVKRMYSDRPSGVFKALYPEFFSGEYGEIKPEPKSTKWF